MTVRSPNANNTRAAATIPLPLKNYHPRDPVHGYRYGVFLLLIGFLNDLFLLAMHVVGNPGETYQDVVTVFGANLSIFAAVNFKNSPAGTARESRANLLPKY
jgi:hypothetical protein